MDNYCSRLVAERLGGSSFFNKETSYKFEKIKRWKKAAMLAHPERELLDFGVGENDEMADGAVRLQLKAEVDLPENRGYADNGIDAFKEAAADWLKRQFGVSIDPKSEAVHCIGSKSALALLPAAFINPGDVTLMTIPGYPVAGTHTKYLGGSVYNLPLTKENGFLPRLDQIPEDICGKAKLLVINYPNSPTGATASVEFFREVVEFAKRHEILVVHDAAHVMLTYGKRPMSFLEVDGAKEVGVEVHSMSKGFNMIGWRLGFLAGNPYAIKAFSEIKDNSDSGQFKAIQKAAIAALNNDAIPGGIREKYSRRLAKLSTALSLLGFDASVPGGTYFMYVQCPKGVKGKNSFKDAHEVTQFLLENEGIVTVPWEECGAFLRFSVTYEAATESDEERLMLELKSRLSKYEFAF
jgi:LL-diaminopimelate aminotransferase